MKLKGLKARSVRGIPRDWPDLAIGDRGMIIFGPNGVGKSSIVDALEYAISAKTSLYPVRRQNVNWDNGAPHIRGGAPEVAVEISGGNGPFYLAPHNEPDGISEDDQRWIATARNASFVLRRHMLLQFITEEPSGRYTLLEPFMNLGAYQGVEYGLKDWNDQLETGHAAATTTVAERAAPLRAIFRTDPAESINEAALLARLNSVLRELGLAEVPASKELENRQAQVAGELGGAEQNARLAALGALKTGAQHLGRGSDLAEILNALVAALGNLDLEMEARTDAILTDLLVRGKEVIEAAGLDTCPVCGQDIDREAVIRRLNERIEADERITAARRLVTERRVELLEHVRTLAGPMKLFIQHWGQHVKMVVPEAYAQIAGLLDELEAALENEKPNTAQMREFVPRLAASVISHDEVIATLDRLILDEGGGDRRRRLNSAASMIEAMLTDWPRYEAAVNDANAIEGTKTTVSRLHGHAVEARKSALRSTLDDVAKSANEFYDTIHPDEGIATSSLQVRDVGQGSVILFTDFHGTRENPLLHYSESHLDTLGLCYFLALRKREALMAPCFKVVVLDDVMHSVDSDHRARIAGLIKDKFADHQVIITTHDVHFYDALRRELGTGGYTYGRINNWDLERGPIFGDPLTDFDRIMMPAERERLSEESLSSAGGRFVEWLLRETTEAIEVSIPARFKRGYEIGQLWPALAARLRRHKGYAAVHHSLIDGLEQNSWVRNACGAHYNPAPAPPTSKEVREFAAMLAALYETLYCKDCGKFISRQADRSWRCPNGHVCYTE
jgi:hypothetical protein